MDETLMHTSSTVLFSSYSYFWSENICFIFFVMYNKVNKTHTFFGHHSDGVRYNRLVLIVDKSKMTTQVLTVIKLNYACSISMQPYSLALLASLFHSGLSI